MAPVSSTSAVMAQRQGFSKCKSGGVPPRPLRSRAEDRGRGIRYHGSTSWLCKGGAVETGSWMCGCNRPRRTSVPPLACLPKPSPTLTSKLFQASTAARHVRTDRHHLRPIPNTSRRPTMPCKAGESMAVLVSLHSHSSGYN